MYTASEIAKKLRISLACVYALVESGQLACYRIGTRRGTIRISEEQLQHYLQRAMVKPVASEEHIR
jgi:excisionase family DNA binding protein